jgi:hypothetical protein
MITSSVWDNQSHARASPGGRGSTPPEGMVQAPGGMNQAFKALHQGMTSMSKAGQSMAGR